MEIKMASIEPPQIHEQFDIKKEGEFKNDISEKERMHFKRDSVRYGFGYFVVGFSLFVIGVIIVFGEFLKLTHMQNVAWTLFVSIVSAGVAFVFGTNERQKNDNS
jgi:hypothetical protein